VLLSSKIVKSKVLLLGKKVGSKVLLLSKKVDSELLKRCRLRLNPNILLGSVKLEASG